MDDLVPVHPPVRRNEHADGSFQHLSQWKPKRLGLKPIEYYHKSPLGKAPISCCTSPLLCMMIAYAAFASSPSVSLRAP